MPLPLAVEDFAVKKLESTQGLPLWQYEAGRAFLAGDCIGFQPKILNAVDAS